MRCERKKEKGEFFSHFHFKRRVNVTMAAGDNNAATKQPAATPGTVPALASQVGQR